MNRLANETSPYLRQHADNPVDWHPWGEEALELARSMDRPVLLSIGYSSCHGCHVMARESFEDPAIAEVLNDMTVSVKVDRDERPDLDRIYQLTHRLLNREPGGWPLTAFVDPHSMLPFYSGTYFPRQPRYGLPGFGDLVRRIAEVYRSKRDELDGQGQKLAEVLKQLEGRQLTGERELGMVLDVARKQLEEQYDAAEGGFGRAPKFPMPAALDRLFRHWARSRDDRARKADRDALGMVTATLTKMSRGGIYDHVGGGFFRYATDRQWAVPHFEKMLYDNGVLLALYADVLALGPDPLFTPTVRETAGWLMRDMQQPDGGYSSAVDADSEGEEGRYYVWRRPEVKRLLTEDEYVVVETLYGLDKPANFEGKWNLRRRDAWAAVVERLYLDRPRADALLASARAKLLEARNGRVPPAIDDKVLAAWNGLAIHGMARAAIRMREPAWLESASRAAEFVRTHMVEDGRLYATWKDGVARHPGYLDDYANMLQGLLSLLSARWRDEELLFATFLGDELLKRFQDRESGGFYFTAHDHEKLIHRPKPTSDDSPPPGNAIAASALTTLAHLTGEPKYQEVAERALSWAHGFVEQAPARHCLMLSCMESRVQPPEQVVIRGPAEALEPWLAAAREGYRPQRLVYGIPYDCREVPMYLPKLVSTETRAKVSAFVCSNLACSPPITDFEAFKQALS